MVARGGFYRLFPNSLIGLDVIDTLPAKISQCYVYLKAWAGERFNQLEKNKDS